MTAALGRMEEFAPPCPRHGADRGERRRARRAAVPDRRLLRRRRPRSRPSARCWPCGPNGRPEQRPAGPPSAWWASAIWVGCSPPTWWLPASTCHLRRGRAGRQPRWCLAGADLAEVARRAEAVVLSLPDGAASEQVAMPIADVPRRHVSAHVVDTSTDRCGGRPGGRHACWRRPESATWTRRCRAGWPGPGRAPSR